MKTKFILVFALSLSILFAFIGCENLYENDWANDDISRLKAGGETGGGTNTQITYPQKDVKRVKKTWINYKSGSFTHKMMKGNSVVCTTTDYFSVSIPTIDDEYYVTNNGGITWTKVFSMRYFEGGKVNSSDNVSVSFENKQDSYSPFVHTNPDFTVSKEPLLKRAKCSPAGYHALPCSGIHTGSIRYGDPVYFNP